MLYYVCRDGKIVDEYDVHKAFEICTGETYSWDSIAYSKWLYSLMGKAITKVMTETEVDIEYFIRNNAIIPAVRVYRDRNNCTLLEAKKAVDKMRENIFNMEV